MHDFRRIAWCAACVVVFSSGCALYKAEPDDNEHIVSADDLFPFNTTSNWWMYSDNQGHRLSIRVGQVVNDDEDIFYSVTFQETGLDTSSDWFRSGPSGIEYSISLPGPYELFLPRFIDKSTGSFTSGTSTVSYSFHETRVIGVATYTNVLHCVYSTALVHGFDEIDFADSTGMICLSDNAGRFPVTYILDSASVNGIIYRY